MSTAHAAPLVVTAALLLGGAACDTAECHHFLDCPDEQSCTSEGRCVAAPGQYNNRTTPPLDPTAPAPPAPWQPPAVAEGTIQVLHVALGGDLGPVLDVHEDAAPLGGTYPLLGVGAASLMIFGVAAPGGGSGFVSLNFNDVTALMDQRGATSTAASGFDDPVWSQACSNSADGSVHYDTMADQVDLDVTPQPDGALHIEFAIVATAGTLSGSAEETHATGSFDLVAP